MSLDRPIFVFSVDFELLWGYVFYPNDRAVKLLINDPTYGRSSTLTLLGLLDHYRLPSTWATVGNLFLEPTAGRPTTPATPLHHSWAGRLEPRLFHAPDLIAAVSASPTGHEIAYHSLSHPRFTECSRETARHELDAGVQIAAESGYHLRSFVFPENKIGHLDLLQGAGFQIFRGSTRGSRDGARGTIARLAGAIQRRLTAHPVWPTHRAGLWEIPGSMFFGDTLLPATLVARARHELRAALQQKAIFHLWIHPQDLLLDPGLIPKLDTVLAAVAEQRDRGTLAVMTMADLALALDEPRSPMTDRAMAATGSHPGLLSPNE